MTPIQARKNELLLTSAINREVIRLEIDYLRRGASWLKPEGLVRGKMRLIAPLAGFLLAWGLRRAPAAIRDSFAVTFLRKVLDVFNGTPQEKQEKVGA